MKIRNCHADAVTGEVTEQWVDVNLPHDPAADNGRADRNSRLMTCDWTTLSDVPLSTDQRAAWEAYRQALRDVTSQAGFPDAINWPDSPQA